MILSKLELIIKPNEPALLVAAAEERQALHLVGPCCQKTPRSLNPWCHRIRMPEVCSMRDNIPYLRLTKTNNDLCLEQRRTHIFDGSISFYE